MKYFVELSTNLYRDTQGDEVVSYLILYPISPNGQITTNDGDRLTASDWEDETGYVVEL